jgi:hypothetical protein
MPPANPMRSSWVLIGALAYDPGDVEVLVATGHG